MFHSLFIHSHIGGYLGEFGTNMNKAVVNIITQVLFVNILLCPLVKYLEVELLSHRIRV